jgi:hypothetical protein
LQGGLAVAQTPPINASDYYEFFPPSEHRVGDIWSDLPTFGMLGIEHVTGIVITPACDLQNCKVETITYLPIVSVRQVFSLRGFSPTVVKTINGLAQTLGIDGLDDGDGPFSVREATQLDAFVERIKKRARSPKMGEKEKVAVKRALTGISLLRRGHEAPVRQLSGTELETFFGSSQFAQIVQRFVTNSQRADMHFLPSDSQRAEWSAIPEPSLALFRYVFSAPIEIFDCAQDVSRADWSHETRRMSSTTIGALSFAARRPMKRQTMRPRFAADLLTRYVAMHVRLGAPDFTDASIDAYVADVVGAKK